MARFVRTLVFAALPLALVLIAADCSRPASGESLRVTYYYLPG
jgi:hypothetical protein